MRCSVFAILSLVLATSARPSFRPAKRANFTLKNGEDAITLKYVFSVLSEFLGGLTRPWRCSDKFKTLTPTSKCTTLGEAACVNGQFARCANGGRLSIVPCRSGEV